MHEASLMRDLMRKIDAVAEGENARRVTAVRVWLGALSHMSPEHFGEHFRQASADTMAAGAEIRAETSDDISHPDAQHVRLLGIEIEA